MSDSAENERFFAENERFFAEYSISSQYAQEMTRKRAVFQQVSKTKKAVHLVLVTTQGVAPGINQYSVSVAIVSFSSGFRSRVSIF